MLKTQVDKLIERMNIKQSFVFVTVKEDTPEFSLRVS